MDFTTPHSIIDLTRVLDPASPGVDFEPARTLEKDGWNAQTLTLYSHIGTHMDAPFHFGVSDQTIETLPPNRLMGKAWIVHIPHIQGKELITSLHVQAVADKIQPGDNLLLRTNWSKVREYERFRNELPRIGEDLAHWCVEKKINILGVEPPSVADVNNLEEVTQIHHILMKGDVLIVEGLVNLDKITTNWVWLIALPLPIKAGDGSPIRALALIPNLNE